MTDLDTRHPEFTIALRGYDRLQVDEYVERLQSLVLEAEERVREAESERVFDEHAQVGPRISQIFELAEEEAQELRGRLEREGKELREKARADARNIVEHAEQIAQEATDRQLGEHEQMLREFEQERDRIRQEVSALEQRKSSVLSELRRLQQLLSGAGSPDGLEEALPAAEEPLELEERAPGNGGNGSIPYDEQQTVALPSIAR